MSLAALSALVGEGEGELVRYRAAIVDASGNELTTVPAGGDFVLRIFVQDLRTSDPRPSTAEDDRGVFAGYLDVEYNANLATFVGPIVEGPDYAGFTDPGTQQPGILNEVGVTQTSLGLGTPLGGAEKLFWSAAFRAATTLAPEAVNDTLTVNAGSSNNLLDVLANDSLGGTLTFTPNPPEGGGHETLLLEPPDSVPNNQILFVSDSVTLGGSGKPTITAVGTTNHGGTVAVVENGTRIRYTPAPGFTGAETFTYTVQSGSQTAQATATVNVVQPIDKVQFAKDLAAAGVKFYGAAWCPFCTEQKQLFEDGQHFLPFIEVTNPDRTINQVGQQNNVTTFPTWDIPDPDSPGSTIRRTGVLTLQELSDLSGVPIPTGTDPFLLPLPNVTLLAGAPLHVPLDGYDPNGTKLTYTVQVTGTSGVTATLLPTTRSMRIDMQGYGDMVFRLFDNEVPRVTDAIAKLAQDNVYDGVIFHRIINNFVIQGGDPTGTGFGDPNLPKFDDQFHFDLQHTQTGLLSMAKAGDDTNSSQFFITEVNPANARQLRALDFNHSVFGVLVEGEDVRAAISDTATDASDRPINTVRMTSVEIFTDEENGVLRLKAPAGTTGTATVTVTATDMEGKSTTRSFNVTVQPDTFNGGPFLADIPPVRTAINTPVTFQLQGRDVENDPVTYTAQLPAGANPTFTFNVNAATGAVAVTPPQNFVGTLELLVGVRPQTTSDTGDPADTQLVKIEVAPEAPSGIDLLPASDTGILNDDNITNATQLQFQVNGVRSGALVEVFRGTQLVGTATATGTSVTISTTNPALLIEGTHQFTARQTVDGAQSNASTALSVTIDRTAPPPMTSTPPTEASVGNLYTYNAENPQETTPGVFYTLVNPPTGATIHQSTGVVSWTPTASQVGAQSFQVRARDAAGNSVDQSVSVTVITGPGRSDQYTTTEDTPLTVNAADGVLKNDDPDNQLGRPLTATRVANAQNGNVTLNADGSFTYTPNPNFQGTDTFTYRVSSGAQQGNVATVTINVTNTLDAPTAVNDTYTATEDQTLTVNQADGVQKNDVNPDGVPLTSVVVANPTNGSLSLNANGSFSYTPNANFSGTDTFTYRLTSSSGNSNTATVTINVTGQNDPPVAVNDTYSAIEDQVLTVDAANGVLKNDTDPEGQPLVALLVTNPQHGTLNFNAQNGSFTYTPAPNFFGTDTFTYRASDNNSNSLNVATVTINVAGRPDAPTVQNLTFTSYKNSPRTFFALADFRDKISDPDGNNQTYRVTAVANPSQQGTVEVGNNGTGFFYNPRANFTGTETFSITITDQDNQSVTATATVTILEFKPGSIAGFVYLDADNDGVLDADEGRVAGITMTLTGTLANGTAVAQRTAITKADGSYKFDNLQPGTYTVAQTQPELLVDGRETVGSQGGTSATNDRIVITLAEGVDGTGNNFGEMRPVASYSILDFLHVKPANSVLVAANNGSASAYYIIERGWQNLASLDVRLTTNKAAATINIEEADGDKLQAQNYTGFVSLFSTSSRSLIRFAAERLQDFAFQPVTATQAASFAAETSQGENAPASDAEGESDSDAPVVPTFAARHEVSIRDFFAVADVSASTTLADSVAAAPALAQAVDAVLVELAHDEEEAAVRDAALDVRFDDADYLDAVDRVFEEDVLA